MMGLSFLLEKRILTRLKREIIFALKCFVMKLNWLFLSPFQIKNLKTRWIYYSLLMVVNRIMCTSKILADLCFTKQKIKIKNTFVKVAYSVLVVKMRYRA